MLSTWLWKLKLRQWFESEQTEGSVRKSCAEALTFSHTLRTYRHCFDSVSHARCSQILLYVPRNCFKYCDVYFLLFSAELVAQHAAALVVVTYDVRTRYIEERCYIIYWRESGLNRCSIMFQVHVFRLVGLYTVFFLPCSCTSSPRLHRHVTCDVLPLLLLILLVCCRCCCCCCCYYCHTLAHVFFLYFLSSCYRGAMHDMHSVQPTDKTYWKCVRIIGSFARKSLLLPFHSR